MASTTVENEQDGPIARRIADAIPYYPFHGVPRFYDISGMLQDPELFQLCIDVFARRYAALEVDCIAGVDARGFILGPPIALALKKVLLCLIFGSRNMSSNITYPFVILHSLLSWFVKPVNFPMQPLAVSTSRSIRVSAVEVATACAPLALPASPGTESW